MIHHRISITSLPSLKPIPLHSDRRLSATDLSIIEPSPATSQCMLLACLHGVCSHRTKLLLSVARTGYPSFCPHVHSSSSGLSVLSSRVSQGEPEPRSTSLHNVNRNFVIFFIYILTHKRQIGSGKFFSREDFCQHVKMHKNVILKKSHYNRVFVHESLSYESQTLMSLGK